MKAVLATLGTTGDLEPFLALGIELRRHGHEVVVASSPAYRERVERLGFHFEPLGSDDFLHRLSDGITAQMTEGLLAAHRRGTSLLSVEDVAQVFRDLVRVGRQGDALVAIAPLTFGEMVHSVTRVPYVSIHPDAFNEEYRDADAEDLEVVERLLAGVFNAFRKLIGVAPVARPLSAGHSPELALFATSRLVYTPEKQPEWPAHHHVTGHFFVESDDEPEEDPALEAFLEAGEPPVLISFGSMKHEDPGALTDLLLDAVRRSGRRALLQGGWARLGEGRELPEGVHPIGFKPYSWLLPRVSCFVQPAGAGATAWALRAGVPTVCVPHVWGQFSYALFARGSGFAGPVVPFGELTAEALGAAIAETVSDPSYRAAAERLRAVVEAEEGVRGARRLIEEWYRGREAGNAVANAGR